MDPETLSGEAEAFAALYESVVLSSSGSWELVKYYWSTMSQFTWFLDPDLKTKG